jgi:toxin ParE1/3/4
MSPAEWSVFITRSAEADLLAIYDYIAERAGAGAAYRFSQSIETYCLDMGTVPERGTRRDDLRPGLRTVGFKRRATVVFELDRQRRKVIILGIYYAGRSFADKFEDEI